MTPEQPEGEPVTAQQASEALRIPVATIRVWIHRYGATRLGEHGRHVYYDMRDLRIIERERRHGHPVPATAEERESIRLCCPLRAAELAARSADAA